MTEEQNRRVVSALQLGGATQRTAVDAFSTAEQLHQFALNFNPNDEPLVCLAVVEHELCDHGTALFLFWQFEALVRSFYMGTLMNRRPRGITARVRPSRPFATS